MSLEADWFLRAHPEITTIEALLPDCNGIMRGKWVPRHKLATIFEGELKLPKTALSLDIWGRDVEKLVFATGDADAGAFKFFDFVAGFADFSGQFHAAEGERDVVVLSPFDVTFFIGGAQFLQIHGTAFVSRPGNRS